MIWGWREDDMRLIVVICKFARGKQAFVLLWVLFSHTVAHPLTICLVVLLASHFVLLRLLSIRHPAEESFH